MLITTPVNLGFQVLSAVPVPDPPPTATANAPVCSPPTNKFLSSHTHGGFCCYTGFFFLAILTAANRNLKVILTLIFPDSEGC